MSHWKVDSSQTFNKRVTWLVRVLNELRAYRKPEKCRDVAPVCLKLVLFATVRYLFRSPIANAPSSLDLGRRSSGQGGLSLSPVGRCLV